MATVLPMFTPQHDHTPHGEPRKGDEAAHTLAKELLENGTEPDEVRERLLELGLDPLTATKYVDELQGKASKKSKKKESSRAAKRSLRFSEANALKEGASRNMRYGAFWLGSGLLITLGTYYWAYGGGIYVVSYGAIIFGALQFGRGVYQKLSI